MRQYDPDRYLCLLFAPQPQREALFALHAFELELARIPERTSEAMLGAIRLQWWRESLEGIRAGSPRRHEVVGPLAQAHGEHGLDLDLLDGMIDGWDVVLEREEAPDLAAREEQMAATRGAGMLAALRMVGGAPFRDDEALARHAGLALALGDLLAGAGDRAALGRPVLPRDVLARHGLDLGTMPDGRREERMAAAAAELAGRAWEHVGAVRAAAAGLPRDRRRLLLPVAMVAHDLGRLRRAGHDVFAGRFLHRGAGRQLALAFRALFGRL